MSHYIIRPQQLPQLIDVGVTLANQRFVDSLNCRVSFCRQRASIPFDTALQHAKSCSAAQWGLYFRKAFGREPAYYELSVRFPFQDHELFIFLHIPPEEFPKLQPFVQEPSPH